MANIIILLIFLILIVTIGWVIYKFKDNKVSIFKFLAAVFTIILILVISLNIYDSNRMPIILKASRSYIMDVNETKTSSGTTIKVKKILLDLNNINATYSVGGKEKVVAIEAKENLDDGKPLNQFAGLWVGSSFIPENSFIGFSYRSDTFIDPIYLVFYLSNGEEVPFEIQDRAHVKDTVRIIDLNETIDCEGSYLKLISFNKGINYSSIYFKSNFSPNGDIIDVRLIMDGVELDKGTSGFSGGGGEYEGAFSFGPVNGNTAEIRVINKTLNKENTFHVKLQ